MTTTTAALTFAAFSLVAGICALYALHASDMTLSISLGLVASATGLAARFLSTRD